MNRRFFKALAFAIAAEAMLLGVLTFLEHAPSSWMRALEAFLYLAASIGALTWCFYEYFGDKK